MELFHALFQGMNDPSPESPFVPFFRPHIPYRAIIKDIPHEPLLGVLRCQDLRGREMELVHWVKGVMLPS